MDAGQTYTDSDSSLVLRSSQLEFGTDIALVALADGRARVNVTGGGVPGAHELATATGLGSAHTTPVLTVGQVLRVFGTLVNEVRFEALIAADIPALNTSKITTGFPWIVAEGGTGQVTLASAALVVGADTAAVTALAPGALANVARSTGSAWASAQLQHADLGGVTPDQHHTEAHDIQSATGPHTTGQVLTAGEVLRATAAAVFSFQSLIAADIPVLDTAKITTGFPWIVAEGGTGLTTMTATNRLLLTTGATSALTTIVTGANDTFLTVTAGVPGWALLIAADIPNLDTAKITTGFPWIVAEGGTGRITLTSGSVLVGAGTALVTLTAQGSGGGLDADLVDGSHASAFALASHTHPFTDITGTATKAQLPAAVAYEDEANVFTITNNRFELDLFVGKDAAGLARLRVHPDDAGDKIQFFRSIAGVEDSDAFEIRGAGLFYGATAVSLAGHTHAKADITGLPWVVADGGTGLTTLTEVGRLIVSTSATAFGTLDSGAAGGFVRSDGATWVRSTIQASDLPAHTPSAHTHDAADIISGGFNINRGGTGLAGRVWAAGDMLYAATGPSPTAFTAITIGAVGTFLKVNVGTTPSWQSLIAADIPSLDTSKITTGFPWAKADLPSAIAYEDEANVFTLGQTFKANVVINNDTDTSPLLIFRDSVTNRGIISNVGTLLDIDADVTLTLSTGGAERVRITNTAVILGTDPSSTALLRVGGGIVMSGTVNCDSNASGRLVVPVGVDQWAL